MVKSVKIYMSSHRNLRKRNNILVVDIGRDLEKMEGFEFET